MRDRQWYVEIDIDGEHDIHEKVSNWFEGVCRILEVIKKGVPFTCTVDFFYREGDGER